MVLFTSDHGECKLGQVMFIFSPSHHQPNVFQVTKWFLRNQVLSCNWRDSWQLQVIELSQCLWIIFHASGKYSYKKMLCHSRLLKPKRPSKNTVASMAIWSVIIITSMVDLQVMLLYLMFLQSISQFLLWCECSLSKWHSRVGYLQSSRSSKKANPACLVKMATGNTYVTLAICTKDCMRCE